MEEIYRNSLSVITRESGFVRIRRTAASTRDLVAAQNLAERFLLYVPMRERRQMGLLFDVREAPIAADEALAEQLSHLVRELMEGFPRVAVLVATAIGKLQSTRRAREMRSPVRIFDDEAIAMAYARGDEPPLSKPAR